MPQDRPDRPLGAHLQDCIVCLSIESEDFLRMVRPVLSPDLLTSRIPAELYTLAIAYFDTFGRPSGDHFHDELVRFLSQRPEAERPHYVDYVKKIRALPSPDVQYILSKINDFVRAREFEQAAIKFAEFTAQGDFTAAENVMHKALRSGIGRFEMGMDYLVGRGLPLRSDPERSKWLMRTGFKPLDKVIGGFKRGQFVCWMGGYKGKKSWACIHTAVAGLKQGLTVVHVSHEMTLEEIETRYDMMLGGMSSERRPKPFDLTVYNEEDKQFEQIRVEPESVYDWGKVKRVRRRIRRYGGRLLVKKYPMGLVDMREIDRYLQHLEMEGVVADVLINDYADIMAPLDGSKEFRHQINDSYIYHKRLADERNILVVTASQVPDKAVRKARITIKDFAEDRRKAGNVDMALAVCQTDEQEEDNIATIMVVANRSGPQGLKFLVGAVPRIGQFALYSAPPAVKREGKDEG